MSFVLAGLAPERQFNPVRKAQLVIHDAQFVLDRVLGPAQGTGYFAIVEAFGDQFDNLKLAGHEPPQAVIFSVQRDTPKRNRDA